MDNAADIRAVIYGRVKPRLFNLLAAISLVLCVATVALWVRSKSYWYQVGVRGARRGIVTDISDGSASIGVRRWWSAQSSEAKRTFHVEAPPLDLIQTFRAMFPGFHSFLAFGFGRYDGNRGTELFCVLPLWAPESLFVLLSLAFHLKARRLQLAPGHCAKCNHDLRASEERCPECGTAIPRGGGEAA